MTGMEDIIHHEDPGAAKPQPKLFTTKSTKEQLNSLGWHGLLSVREAQEAHDKVPIKTSMDFFDGASLGIYPLFPVFRQPGRLASCIFFLRPNC
jgi:hypothetical protein